MRPSAHEILEAALDTYERAARKAAGLQRALAGVMGFEPVRSILQATADLTTDVVAVQLSGARWLLDS